MEQPQKPENAEDKFRANQPKIKNTQSIVKEDQSKRKGNGVDPEDQPEPTAKR